MIERRIAPRRPFEVFFNKYLAGYPYLCQTLELSTTGALARTILEPTESTDCFSLELKLPGQRWATWVWAREVWRRGAQQALVFLKVEESDLLRLQNYLAKAPGGLGVQRLPPA